MRFCEIMEVHFFVLTVEITFVGPIIFLRTGLIGVNIHYTHAKFSCLNDRSWAQKKS